MWTVQSRSLSSVQRYQWCIAYDWTTLLQLFHSWWKSDFKDSEEKRVELECHEIMGLLKDAFIRSTQRYKLSSHSLFWRVWVFLIVYVLFWVNWVVRMSRFVSWDCSQLLSLRLGRLYLLIHYKNAFLKIPMISFSFLAFLLFHLTWNLRTILKFSSYWVPFPTSQLIIATRWKSPLVQTAY